MWSHLCRALCLAAIAAVAAAADVTYQEEVVNSGVGPSRRGARRTVQEVAIKGTRQRVVTDIETSKEMTRVLQQQGKALQGTTILRLDQGRLYDIDRSTKTYRQQSLPTAKPASAPVAAPPDTAREIVFRTQALPETKAVAGVPCRRVAAEMTARHFRPGTKEVVRTNRYLYQAWMADDFPGYAEIDTFLRLQQQQTSLPPLVRGGLEQLGEGLEDPDRLERELAALRGFAFQSELTVTTAVGSQSPRQVFKLSRKILRISHQPIADDLFQPSEDLKQVP